MNGFEKECALDWLFTIFCIVAAAIINLVLKDLETMGKDG